jgi:mono/diheme cytochrome c family protein
VSPRAWLVALALAASLVACDAGGATPDWSRMIDQPRPVAFGASDLFADGRAMRPVPLGAVPRGWIADRARREGRGPDGRELDTVPLPITDALLARGRDRFAIVCATCHGPDGRGDGAVARAMQRRPPPSLLAPRIVARSPGAIYRAITDGYGLMPSSAALLTVDDRWAVIAFLRTLELAAGARVDALPAILEPPARGGRP